MITGEFLQRERKRLWREKQGVEIVKERDREERKENREKKRKKERKKGERTKTERERKKEGKSVTPKLLKF